MGDAAGGRHRLPAAVAAGDPGAWKWRRAGWPLLLCLLPAVYYTGLHMVFVSSIRYRQPAMMVWLILAAGVIGSWLESMATPGDVAEK